MVVTSIELPSNSLNSTCTLIHTHNMNPLYMLQPRIKIKKTALFTCGIMKKNDPKASHSDDILANASKRIAP
jgi:hypothetical protein